MGTEEGKNSWADYNKFQEAWIKAFQDLTATVDGIKQDLDSFGATGKVEHLISALSQILSRASDLVLNSVPGELAKDMSRYLDSLNAAFASLGEAIRQFEDGDTLGGVEAVYFGLRNATESLLPLSVTDNAVCSTIVGTLDGIVGDLSKDIL